MNNNVVVCDTGALISLEKLRGGYSFIQCFYNHLLLPPAVFEELTFGNVDTAEYLQRYQVQDLFIIREPSIKLYIPSSDTLHRGEIDAIRLAWELKCSLLIEEYAGRAAASQLGIPISGIAGQILKAYRTNTITATEAMTKIHELLHAGRIGQKLYLALVNAINSTKLL